MDKIAIAGASGFIGKHLKKYLDTRNYSLVLLPRKPTIGDLEGVDTLINLVGRGHVLREKSDDPFSEYEEVNCNYAVELFELASKQRVRLFIQVSSIAVLGDHTCNEPFNTNSPLAPTNDYSLSKANAEQQLTTAADKSSTGLCIVRPPLVYGRGAKGNYERLQQLVTLPLVFPFGNLKNKRDFVGVDNLCDFLLECIKNQSSIGEVFLVSDDKTVSTIDFMRFLAEEKGERLLVIGVMPIIVRLLFGLPVLGLLLKKMFVDLEIDISDTKEKMGWRPPFSLEEGLKKSVTNDVEFD